MTEERGSIEDLHREYGGKIVRAQLRKIVEIYDEDWIVAHELIQNAVDAVQANENASNGEVQCILHLDDDLVEVRDNGTGFKRDLDLLCPGGTGEEKRFSSRSATKGYQGVGLKAVMYSTRKFEIESHLGDGRWDLIAEDLSDYIQDDTSTPEYLVEYEENGNEETGTTVRATFGSGSLNRFVSGLNRFLNPDTETWKKLYLEDAQRSAEEAYKRYVEHFLSWYFRTWSYVGCANRLLDIPVRNPKTGELEEVKPITIEFQLLSATGYTGVTGTLGEWLRGTGATDVRVQMQNRAWDYREIAEENRKRARKFIIAPEVETTKPSDPNWDKLSTSFRDKLLDVKLVPDSSKTGFRDKYADYISILERPRRRVRAEDFADVFEKVTGIYLAVGRTAFFEQLGIRNRGIRLIASNGTPSDHELSVSSTSSTWYLETIHMVVNVDSQLNLGKRHLSNTRLVGRIREFFEQAYPTLVNISKLFVERDSGGPTDDEMPSVAALRAIRRKKIPHRRFPDDEDALVGLFSAGLAVATSEIAVYGFFRKARYDGRFLWDREAEVSSDADLKTLEFKLSLEALVHEFDHAVESKEFKEVDLIVVWNRQVSNPDWHVKGLSSARENELANLGVPTDLVEYVLENRWGDWRPLISVPELVQRVPLEDGQTDDIDAYVHELG